MRKDFFATLVFLGITCIFVEAIPKLLTVVITFLKLKGSVSDDYLLQAKFSLFDAAKESGTTNSSSKKP